MMARCLAGGVLALFLAAGGSRLLAIFLPLPWMIHDPLVYFPTVGWLLAGLHVALFWRWTGKSHPAVWLMLGLVLLGNIGADLRIPLAGSQEPAGGQAYRLLSYNIFQARMADEEILMLINDLNPDLVLLQEVPAKFYQRHSSRLQRSYRYVHHHNQLLLATNATVLESDIRDLPGRRSVLRARISANDCRFNVLNTHLSMASTKKFFPRLVEQQQQTEEILALVADSPCPFLIAGDFNLPLHSTCYRRFSVTLTDARSNSSWGPGYTYPSYFPFTAIDHCFASWGVRLLGCTTVPVILSDHRPLLVRFALTPTRE